MVAFNGRPAGPYREQILVVCLHQQQTNLGFHPSKGFLGDGRGQHPEVPDSEKGAERNQDGNGSAEDHQQRRRKADCKAQGPFGAGHGGGGQCPIRRLSRPGVWTIRYRSHPQSITTTKASRMANRRKF